jgi:hypothetical protein
MPLLLLFRMAGRVGRPDKRSGHGTLFAVKHSAFGSIDGGELYPERERRQPLDLQLDGLRRLALRAHIRSKVGERE